jgi:hypothetical protein
MPDIWITAHGLQRDEQPNEAAARSWCSTHAGSTYYAIQWPPVLPGWSKGAAA